MSKLTSSTRPCGKLEPPQRCWKKELTTAARRFLLLDATYGQLAPDRFAAPPRPTSRRGEWIVTDSVWETDVPHLTRLNLASKEPAPIYMHERVGQDCEHDAPEWQAEPAVNLVSTVQKYASGTRERFLVTFGASGHTYAMQGKDAEDALKKESPRQLPSQPVRKLAPVPTATSQ